MKNRKWIFLGLSCLCLLLGACSHPRYPSSLMVADSLCQTCPDSAVALLDSLRPQMEQEKEAVRMFYYLLCIKARDKAYLSHTSDSLVLSVLHYYEDKQDRRLLPEAYYYAGRVVSDLGDAPQALDYFQKALDAMPEGEMTDLRSHVVSQMGTLFTYQHLYPEALEMYKQSLKYSEQLGDTLGMAYSLRDIGNTYRQLSRPDSTLYFLQWSADLSRQQGDMPLFSTIQSHLASYYAEGGHYDKALDALHLALSNGKTISSIYSIAGKLYHEIGKIDSAIWYYKQLLKQGNIYAKHMSYGNLGQIAVEQLGDAELALAYLKEYVALSDSIKKLNYSREVQRAHSLFNYNLQKRERMRLQAENKKKEIWLSIAYASLVLLIFVFPFYYNHRRKLYLKRIRKAEQMRDEQYRNSKAFVHASGLRLRELESQVDGLNQKLASMMEEKKKLETLVQTIKQQSEKSDRTHACEIMKLKKQNHTLLCQLKDIQQEKNRLEKEKILVACDKQVSEAMQTKRRVMDGVLAASDICLHFERLLQEHQLPTPEDWDALQKLLDEKLDFTHKLEKICRLKNRDMHICCLVRIGWGNANISKMVNMSSEGVASACLRMCAKTFVDTKPSSAAWHKFIRSL